MVIQDFRPAAMLFVALAYFAIVGQVVARRQVAGAAGLLLAVYGAAGGAWALLDALRFAAWLTAWPTDLVAHLPFYATLSLSIIFLRLTRVFVRAKMPAARWDGLAGACLALLVAADANLLRVAGVLATWPGWFIGRAAFTQVALVVGWGLYTLSAGRLTLQAYHRAAQPLHRNRLAYWSIAFALAVAAMAVLLVGQEAAAMLVLLGAGLVAMLSFVTHHLLDVRQALRSAASVLVTTVLAIAVYAGAILVAPAAQRFVPGLSGALMAILLGLFAVLAANPLLSRLQNRLHRWASGTGYDAPKIIGEYGLTIGGILELDRLAAVALAQVQEAIGIDRGALFVVDAPSSDASQAQFYRLRTVGSLGPPPPSGALLADGQLAAYLTQEFAILTQYELDLNPRFRDISAAERMWLQGLSMDVYVPIYASQRWIGLMALGPKLSRHRYFDDDLQLLGTLAGQTAVALQNARLVDDLVRLNAEIQQANAALDQANHRLAQMDRIKSDFINVISHELRTPLSILFGYTQILLGEASHDGDDYHRQLVEGINTGTTRMQEIIENMLDVTKIDSRALALSSSPVAVEVVLRKVLAQLGRPLAERRLEVDVDNVATLPSIEADGAALTKVFHHLLVNAIKFTPDGGRITVTGRSLEEPLPAGAVEIAISDTGIGIDPRFLDLIFTKFYQMGEVALHSSGKTKFKGGGPGLGLAIARGIVEAHGGHLRAESSGHDEMNFPGSRFVVILPRSQSQSVESGPRP